jgi:hypothetical protein
VLFLAIPCPLRHSPENNLRKLLRFCRDPDPNAERLERFIWRGFYYRVSTGKQDIEMPQQRAAVEAFLNSGGWKIIGEEVEVETGTKLKGCVLANVLLHARARTDAHNVRRYAPMCVTCACSRRPTDCGDKRGPARTHTGRVADCGPVPGAPVGGRLAVRHVWPRAASALG